MSAAPAEPVRLSVLVPTRGRPERVASLQRDLARQTLAPGAFELIVVDDGSPVPLELESSAYATRLLRQAHSGPAAARNRALEHARGALCLILNDDAVLAEDLLEKHVAVHAQFAASGREKLAVLGAFRFTASACQSPFTQLCDRSDLLFEFSPLVHERTYGWGHFWTCNLSLPTEALRDAGGFDAQTFREAVVEDCELGYRLHQCGWRVVYRADLVAHHEHAIDSAGYFERTRRLGRNLAKMYRKHGDATVLRLAAGTTVGEPQFRRWLGTYEALRPQLAKCAAMLARLETEQAGVVLPQSTLAPLAALVARVSAVPFCRGVLEELTAHDPEAALVEGPRSQGPVSIVVPSFDALASTQRCLEALRACADPRHAQEIWFVDNGSRDGSREYLAAQPDVQLLANDTNVGAPRARNQALAQARGDWLVFMDNDVVVTQGWLARLIHHAEIDPWAACIGPVTDRAAHGQAIEYSGGDDPTALARFAAERAHAFAHQARCASLLSSFLVLVRRSAIDAIGGFDERFSPWGFDDDDFTLRAALALGHNRVALDVFVRHASYAGPKLERHTRLLAENWRRFRAKWGLPHDAPHGDYTGLAKILDTRHERDDLYVPYDTPLKAAARA